MREISPWNRVVGLRNILAHDYGEVLVERVWLAATEHIDKLSSDISKYLEEKHFQIDKIDRFRRLTLIT